MDTPASEPQAKATTLAFLANHAQPIETNSIWFGPDGMPAYRDLTTPIGFSFDCAGLTFSARAGRQNDQAWLEIEGDLGALPFSAEARAARTAIILVLLTAKLTDHRYFGVTPDQRIKVRGEIPLASPLTPVSILTGATEFVMAIRPFVELLGEARACPAAFI